MSEVQSKRELRYLGSTDKALNKLPQEVKDLFVAALDIAVKGGKHPDAKPYIGHGPRLLWAMRSDSFIA